MRPYTDRRVPLLIMSNEFNKAQVDSNQVVQVSQGPLMELAPEVLTEGPNTYVNEILFIESFIFNILTKHSKNLFLLCQCGVL